MGASWQRLKIPSRRWLLLASAALLLFALAFVGADRARVPEGRPGSRDVDLYAAVVGRVAAGESYYTVLSTELPTRGYAVRPVLHWRLPTLAWLLAGTPTPALAHALLWGIGLLTMWVWAGVLRLRAGAVVLVLIAPLWLVFSSTTIYMHELWSGQLIALAVGLRLQGRTGASIAAIVLAALIREHAVLALVTLAAWSIRDVRSARAWGVALVAIVVVYLVHFIAVVQHTPPEGLTKGWSDFLGWPFAVNAIRVHVLLIAAPYWVAALVAGLSMPVLWAWREGRLVAVVVTGYLVLFCAGGRPDNWYWGLLIVPLLPLGWIALAQSVVSARRRSTPDVTPRAPDV